MTSEADHRAAGHVRGRERSDYRAVCPRCGGPADVGWVNSGDQLDEDWWQPGRRTCRDRDCLMGRKPQASDG